MSTTTSPTESPVHVQPLHQASLGNTTSGTANEPAGLGAKALLAKKMAKSINPTFVSPTDNMMTPCTKKISAAKKRHFTKGAKPMKPLFAQAEAKESESGSSEDEIPSASKMDDEENPF
ncbi:hypothetical protein BC835DRAFT_1326562 [Cytidiella melzeri]|nr:hypothetical protein BC835DRAFT_1326562 [Cytidiella melzeri]